MMKNHNNHPQASLPPGFRFHPTDEELILHYLMKKVSSTPFPLSIIADVDIYKFDPWDLPAKAAFGEKEWYFFTPRDRKYPNGARPNRAAGSGYWKATGTDKFITAPLTMGMGQENIGIKKALVFYRGKPPKGVKTNWIMHEYRLAENSNYTYNHNKPLKNKDFSMRLDDWVLCRIYRKSHAASLTTITETASDQELEEEQFIQDILLPSLKTPTNNTTLSATHKSCSFSNLLDAVDYSLLSSFLLDNPTNETLQEQPCFSNYANTSSYDYLDNKLPLLISTPAPDNKLKRRHVSDVDLSQPSKKLVNSCSSNQADVSPYRFFNQQLLLSPHLHFHG